MTSKPDDLEPFLYGLGVSITAISVAACAVITCYVLFV